MTDSLWAAHEAASRARELMEHWRRNPDVLSPDEQALAIRVELLEGRLYGITPETLPHTVEKDAPAGTTLMIRIPKKFMVRE